MARNQCLVLILFSRSSARPVAISFFLKNASIRTSSSRTKTSVERALQEQLAAEQVRSAGLIEQVDQLKRKTKKIEREFEEFKKQQREKYNKLREHIMLFSTGKSQSS